MTKFTLSVGSWTKIASAGSTVEVQGQYVFLTQSATVPTSSTDAETLYGSDDYRKYDAPLPFDLYASFSYSGPSSSTLTGSVEVLPIGATSGNGTVQDTAADTALGTPSDQPPAGPTTSGSVIAKLGGIWAALLGTLKVQVQNTNVAVTGTFYQATQPVSAIDGGLATLGTTTDAATATTLVGLTKAVLAKLGAPLAVTGSFYQATQPVSGTVIANLGTLNGAATAAGQASMLAALQGQLDLTTMYLTNASQTVFYVRREVINEGTGAITVVLENLDGSVPSSPPAISTLMPIIAGATITSEATFFDVATAGTGYTVGDVLARVVFTNTSTQAITTSWQNLGPVSAAATLASAPAAANIVEQTRNINITGTVATPTDLAIAGGMGTPTDAAAAAGANGSVVAQLKGILTKLGGVVLAAGSAIIGKVGIDQTTNGFTNAVYVNNIATTAVPSSATANANGYLSFAAAVSGQQAYTPGYNYPLTLNTDGALRVGTYEQGSSLAAAGIAPVVATSATSLVGKSSQGNLYGVVALLTATAAAQTWLVTINAAAVPTSGAVITPVDVAAFGSNAIGATASINYDAGPPNAYTTGIVHLVTTSLTTYTPGAAAFIQSRVR